MDFLLCIWTNIGCLGPVKPLISRNFLGKLLNLGFEREILGLIYWEAYGVCSVIKSD